MFGYIRISKGEMRVKEYELYKAVYCSLCKTLGKEYSIFSRFALSYDFTFLALLELSLEKGFDGVEHKRCVFNPLKRCSYCKNTKSFSLSSAAVIILLYQKIIDDIADEKGFKRLSAYFLKMLYKASYKKAKKKYPKLALYAEDYTKKQRAVEKTGTLSLDEASLPTSEMLSYVFSLCSDDESVCRILKALGGLMGRYIYLMDCACDVQKDAKTGAYNPLGASTKAQAASRVKPQIFITVAEAIKAFELLPIRQFKDILGNILYVGLEDTIKKELL